MEKLWILKQMEEDAEIMKSAIPSGLGGSDNKWTPVEGMGLDDEEYAAWNKKLKEEAIKQKADLLEKKLREAVVNA